MCQSPYVDITCPICNRNVEQLLQVGSSFPIIKELSIIGAGDRLQKCPYCKSSDRDRLVYLFLTKQLHGWISQKIDFSILHVAPERCIAEKLMACGLKYLAIDSFEHGYKYDSYIKKMDLLNLKCSNETFDLVICNHVLQDIYEDKKAMAEIWRVLKRGGMAILQVPISPTLEKTLEHSGILSEDECARRYGQRFHKRIYSATDYIERLQSIGFTVQVIPASEVTDNSKMYSINIKENLFLAVK